jgi:tetratricopeptide (TPR) repeat protein
MRSAAASTRARARRARILARLLSAAGLLAGVLENAGAASPAEPPGTFWGRAASTGRDANGTGGAAAGWFSLAVERTAAGRYAEAAAAYGEALAAGGDASPLYANLGEVLMADGQLAAAEAAYRDAVAVAVAEQHPGSGGTRFEDLRERAQDLSLGLLGLAVALDRDGQTGAARETMRRALALESTVPVLAVASLPNTELFFVPAGDIHYYVGLARAVAGRNTEAAEAFHEFLSEAPASRWAPRAEAHLAALARAEAPHGGDAAAVGRRSAAGPRVMAAGTVLATGGAAAPLIDAAWRDQAAILDDCLDAAPELTAAHLPVRIAIELEIDAHGRVTAATAKLPASLPADLGRCLERAVVARLRLPTPATTRRTRARTELLLGVDAQVQNPQRVPNLPR